MTTVAALAADGRVFMAADSCTNVYERPIVGGAHKIRRVPAGVGSALLGFCGDGGLADTVAADLKLDAEPSESDEDRQSWASAVARAVTDLAVGAGFIEDGRLSGTLLLAWRGYLWTLSHAHAIPIPDGVAAIGSGEGPAMGALDVLRELPTVSPAAAVRRAVEIACARDRYSMPPLHSDST